jgi:hypothetical protein
MLRIENLLDQRIKKEGDQSRNTTVLGTDKLTPNLPVFSQ